jgi:dTDP-4-dehydrorhamnose reductase
MNIIIIGNGQIGGVLSHELSDHTILQWKKDISELTKKDITNFGADVIINAAGKTDLLWCENNPRETFRSNVEAPVELYQRIVAINKEKGSAIRLLHFSSGCIWDGPFDENGKPFTPEHPARPAAYYSWTKAACDELLLKENKESVAILRPRQVYSAVSSPRNTINKINRYPRLVTTPQSMSSVSIISKTVRFLLDAKVWNGIWNIYDKGTLTPYQLGVMLSEAGLREMPEKLEKSELDGFHKPKRVDTVLYDERFEKMIQPEDLSIVMKKTIDEFAANQ